MKYRFGKYAVRMLELVEAYEPELLEWGSGFFILRPGPPGPSSSLDSDKPPIKCAGSVGEFEDGGSDSDVADPRRLVSSRSRSFRSFTQRTCTPAPRCAPTPARRSSSRPRTRHTRRGQRASPTRKGTPLKCDTAACRCASVEKFTNAQLERVIRKIDATPPNSDPALPLDVSGESVIINDEPTGPAGALCVDCAPAESAPADESPEPLPPGDGGELKNRQSSSCVASEGTFPAHITHSERCAGGLG